jgi:Domain of unknown function (DUF4381)
VNPQDPLASLHPLRAPLEISWWPPAPGWWLLLAVAVACLLALGYLLFRRYRANAYRRRALAALESLQLSFREHADTRSYLSQINALLKSVALHAYPRRDVAALSGRQWLDFLNSATNSGELFQEDFTAASYRRETADIDPEQIRSRAATWIKRHKVSR